MFGCCKLGDRLGLGAEAGQLLRAGIRAGQDHLQGDDAVQAELPRLVDDAHAAVAQHFQDLVAGDLRQRWRWRLRASRRRASADRTRLQLLAAGDARPQLRLQLRVVRAQFLGRDVCPAAAALPTRPAARAHGRSVVRLELRVVHHITIVPSACSSADARQLLRRGDPQVAHLPRMQLQQLARSRPAAGPGSSASRTRFARLSGSWPTRL